MSLIKLLNTYLLNDLSFIVYEYYYDFYKNKQLKDIVIEYHNKIIARSHNMSFFVEKFICCPVNYRYINKETYLYIYKFNNTKSGNVGMLPSNY